MTRGIVACMIFLLAYCSAMAQDAGTTKDLYDRCARNEPICGAYLMGAVLGMMGKAYQDPALEPNYMAPFRVLGICPAQGSPMNGYALRQRFMAWVEKNSSQRAEPMGDSAMHAFQEAIECLGVALAKQSTQSKANMSRQQFAVDVGRQFGVSLLAGGFLVVMALAFSVVH